MLNFSKALDLIKVGKRVRRGEWREDTFISLFQENKHTFNSIKMTYINNQDYVITTDWTPSQVDMLEEDWEISKVGGRQN